MEPPGGWLGALMALGALAAGALAWLQGRRKRDAADDADIASDQARAGTYNVLTRERDAALQRATTAELRVAELERENARLCARMELMRGDFAEVEQMVRKLKQWAPEEVRHFLDTNFHVSGPGALDSTPAKGGNP